MRKIAVYAMETAGCVKRDVAGMLASIIGVHVARSDRK